MDFGGGGSTKTVTTTNNQNQPWSEAQPALKQALGAAQDTFNNSEGGNVYDQSLVVPYADDTLQGMEGIKNSADTYSNALQQPMNQQLDILNSGGYNPYQQTSIDRLDSLAASQGFNAQTGQAADTMSNLDTQMRNGGGLTQYQQDSLARSSDLAGGSELMGTNPGFQRNLQNAQEAATNSANEMAMKTGRYNSPAHQKTLSDSVGDITANMYGQEYNQQLQRQDAARGQQFSMSQQGVGNVQQTAQGLGQIGQTGYTNMQDANRDLFESGQVGLGNTQQAAGQIPTAYNALQQPYRDYMSLGGMQEDLQTRQMQDDLRRFREADSAQWDRIAKLNAIATGAGQLGDDSVTTVANPTQSPFASAVSGGIQGGYSNGDFNLGDAAFGALGGLFS